MEDKQLTLREYVEERERLNKKITAVEKTIAETEKDKDLWENYIQTVCGTCSGTGLITKGGADAISDPPWEDTCEFCKGEGFVWKRVFHGKQEYDLRYQEYSTW